MIRRTDTLLEHITLPMITLSALFSHILLSSIVRIWYRVCRACARSGVVVHRLLVSLARSSLPARNATFARSQISLVMMLMSAQFVQLHAHTVQPQRHGQSRIWRSLDLRVAYIWSERSASHLHCSTYRPGLTEGTRNISITSKFCVNTGRVEVPEHRQAPFDCFAWMSE